MSDDSNPRPEGEGARARLLGLLADTTGCAVVAGLLDGVGDGPPDAGAGDAASGHGTARHPTTGTAPRGPVPFLARVCRLAIPEVGVSGAGVTLMGSVADGIAGRRDQIASSEVCRSC